MKMAVMVLCVALAPSAWALLPDEEPSKAAKPKSAASASPQSRDKLVPENQESEPKKVVSRLVNALLDVMKNGSRLGYQGRYNKLAPIVKQTHDFNAISKLLLREYWAMLGDDEKQRFTSLLAEYAIAQYAANFSSYSGESFTYGAEEESKKGTAIVHYLLSTKKEKDQAFEFMLRAVDGQWQILNIVVNGMGYAGGKRAEYEYIIRHDGVAALLDKMSEVNADIAKKAGRK